MSKAALAAITTMNFLLFVGYFHIERQIKSRKYYLIYTHVDNITYLVADHLMIRGIKKFFVPKIKFNLY